MSKATTLTELIDSNRDCAAQHHLSRRRERRAQCLVRRAVRARARHPVSPAEARRAARRQADPVPRQQRAVHRRVLGGGARRHRAGAGGARHQRRASPQAAAHRAQARQAVHLHRAQARSTASARSPRQAGEARHRSTACASRAFLVDDLDDISQRRRAAPGAARRHGLHPVLLGLDQRTQGRGAHARQHHRQLSRLHRGGAASPKTTSACRGCR